MLEIYACTALIVAASLLAGTAIHAVLGWRGPTSTLLAAATGFAALVTLAPFLIRLPGRATTASILLILFLLGAAAVVNRNRVELGRRDDDGDGAVKSRRSIRSMDARTVRSMDVELLRRGFAALAPGLAVAAVIALASLPFLFQDRIGVLGEGIYTNDHAAQLYWTDWLQHGFGPEPSAVSFGYPVGPQALTAIAASVTGADLIAAFNGLLLAIPALTALVALAALRELPAPSRVAVATLAALPYLAASFLAQSGFKETAMALFVLAFAIAIGSLSGRAAERRAEPPRRAVLGVALVLAAASVFTFSLPGLAWFVVAVPLWLAFEALAGRNPIDYGEVAASLRRHRLLVGVTTVILLVIGVAAIGPLSNFLDKVDDVNTSIGRLSSPIFPAEALGIWPEGDYRIVRGEVSGSLLAAALGLAVAGFGAWMLLRRRQLAILAVVFATGAVYVGARLFSEIHVEAKALAIASPLVLLVGLGALASPDGPLRRARYVAAALIGIAALGSTLLALRAAPVGPDDRAGGLESFAEQIDGDSVIFLGVDRFSSYRLRDTLMRAPAGYVPQEIENRAPDKIWQQGAPADFDLVFPRKLDKFRYAISTAAAYQSAPPPNFERVAEEDDYVLWRRSGETPRTKILDEDFEPGAAEPCLGGAGADAGGPVFEASIFETAPAVADPVAWKPVGSDDQATIEDAVGGQERALIAPVTATNAIEIPAAGEYELSLQYHSEVALEIVVDGEVVAELPPSLEGMYLDGAGRGAFWPAGTVDAEAGPLAVTAAAADPTGFQDLAGVEPRVWLGSVAATATGDPVATTLSSSSPCGAYVDHYRALSR